MRYDFCFSWLSPCVSVEAYIDLYRAVLTILLVKASGGGRVVFFGGLKFKYRPIIGVCTIQTCTNGMYHNIMLLTHH